MENATQPHVVVPPSALHTSLPQSNSTAPSNRKRLFIYILIGFAVLVVLGAGAVFASTKGYITLPFRLPFVATSIVEDYQEKNLTRALDSLLAVNSGRYQYDLAIANEPKEAGVQPLDLSLLQPDENANQNNNTNQTPIDYAAEQESWLASILPKDSRLNLLLTALYNKPTVENQIPNTEIGLSGNYAGNNLSIEAALELKMIDQVAYVKVTKIPAIPGFDYDKEYESILNKWLKLDQATLGSYNYIDVGKSILEANGFTSLDQTKAQATIKDILQIALDHKFIVIKEKLANESINGIEARHWRVWFDENKTAETYQAVTDYVKQKFPETDVFEQDTLDYINTANFKQFMGQLEKNTSVDIWLATRDWLPVKFSTTYKIALDAQNENLKDRQIRISATVSLIDPNQPMTIQSPPESEIITLKDVECLASGLTQEVCREAVLFDDQSEQISRLRSTLTAYKFDKASYPESLSLINDYYQTKYTDCLASQNNTNTTNGNSSGISLYDSSDDCLTEKSAARNTASVTDVYTKQPYAYTVKAGAYTLTYQMRYYEGLSEYEKEDYVDGTNTATPEAVSTEAQAIKDQRAADMKKDDDADGLTNADEKTFGTESKKDDTDGDGYKDGAEINNGYNPNGSGKLVIKPSGTTASPKTRDSRRLAYLRTMQSAVELYINETGDTPFAEGDKNWLSLGHKLAPFLASGLSAASQLGCTVNASSGNPLTNKTNNDCLIYCDNGKKYLLATFTESAAELNGDIDAALKTYSSAADCVTNAGPLTAKPSFDCKDPVFCLGYP